MLTAISPTQNTQNSRQQPHPTQDGVLRSKVWLWSVSAPLTAAAFFCHSNSDVFAPIKEPSEESFSLISLQAPSKGCEAAIIPSSPK